MSKRKLICALPVALGSGWGTCSAYYSSLLQKHFDVTLYLPPEMVSQAHVAFNSLGLTAPAIRPSTAPVVCDSSIVLGATVGATFAPVFNVRGTRNFGLFFLEDNCFPFHDYATYYANNPFHAYIAGSKWNQFQCRVPVHVVHQGFDERIFSPVKRKRTASQPFRVFSGGKFETRKGQDIVMNVFWRFLQKYGDSILVTAWWNHWYSQNHSMDKNLVPYLGEIYHPGEQLKVFQRYCFKNGIPKENVSHYGVIGSAEIADLMQSCHVGLFPNRAEGGTNLVLTEAIATGLPCVATASTGQEAIALRYTYHPSRPTKESYLYKRESGIVGSWPEPDEDDLLEKLEQCYSHYQESADASFELAQLAHSELTWRHAVDNLAALLSQ